MKIKRGIGRRVKVANAEYMLRISCPRPTVPPKSRNTPNRLMMRKAMAMGIPVAMRMSKGPKISRSNNCQLMMFTSTFQICEVFSLLS
jgi:hypothetical protein